MACYKKITTVHADLFGYHSIFVTLITNKIWHWYSIAWVFSCFSRTGKWSQSFMLIDVTLYYFYFIINLSVVDLSETKWAGGVKELNPVAQWTNDKRPLLNIKVSGLADFLCVCVLLFLTGTSFRLIKVLPVKARPYQKGTAVLFGCGCYHIAAFFLPCAPQVWISSN